MKHSTIAAVCTHCFYTYWQL